MANAQTFFPLINKYYSISYSIIPLSFLTARKIVSISIASRIAECFTNSCIPIPKPSNKLGRTISRIWIRIFHKIFCPISLTNLLDVGIDFRAAMGIVVVSHQFPPMVLEYCAMAGRVKCWRTMGNWILIAEHNRELEIIRELTKKRNHFSSFWPILSHSLHHSKFINLPKYICGGISIGPTCCWGWSCQCHSR